METKIQYFQSPAFGQIRVTVIDNKPMFVANDVAAMLGYSDQPKAVRTHCKGVAVLSTPTEGGVQNVKFIPESDVYRLIMRSKLPEAEQFQDWVCEDILPAIRKTGGYMVAKVDETPEEIMARALLVAQDTMRRKDERIDIGQSAKILNLPFGRNTLFQKLREMGVFFKNKNEPKQEYVRRGYFVLKEKWIDRNNHDGFMVLKVLVTQKGLEFLASLFKVVRQPKEVAEVI